MQKLIEWLCHSHLWERFRHSDLWKRIEYRSLRNELARRQFFEEYEKTKKLDFKRFKEIKKEIDQETGKEMKVLKRLMK